MQLKPEFQRIIDEQVQSGRYQSVEQVVEAALGALEAQEGFGNFAPGELERLLAEDERDIANGDVVDGATAFANLRARSATRRAALSK